MGTGPSQQADNCWNNTAYMLFQQWVPDIFWSLYLFQIRYIPHFNRALDKREYLVIIRDNFCLFCIKTYVVTPHLNRLDKTVQMRGHNIWF